MNAKPKLNSRRKVNAQCEVHLVGGSTVFCQNREDTELVLDAEKRFFEGSNGRRLPRQTVGALERSGLAGSVLHRSSLRNLDDC